VDRYLDDLLQSRRTFLKAGSAVAAATLLGCDKENPAPPAGTKTGPSNKPLVPAIAAVGPEQRPILTKMGSIVGGGRGKNRTTGEWLYWLSVVDLDQGGRQTRDIKTAFFPHGMSPHPKHPHRLMLFQKIGKGCCEVDLRTGKVLRTVSTSEGYKFYGHGAYSPDGRHFYCTETATDDAYRGLLNVRDSASHKVLGEMPTGGKEPHDCILIDRGKTLVVTNGGGHVDNDGFGSVTYVNTATRQVEHTLRFTDATINAGHLWLTSKGHLAVVSAPRTGLDIKDPKVHGALSFFTPGVDKQPRTIGEPVLSKMRGETLSVVIHEPSMVVGATNPEGNLLTFWDFTTGRLLKSYTNLVGPRGITVTLDQKYFVVSYDHAALLMLIDAKTLEPVAKQGVSKSWMTGSHLLTHDVA